MSEIKITAINVEKVYNISFDGKSLTLTLEQMRDLAKVLSTVVDAEFDNGDVVVTQWDSRE